MWWILIFALAGITGLSSDQFVQSRGFLRLVQLADILEQQNSLTKHRGGWIAVLLTPVLEMKVGDYGRHHEHVEPPPLFICFEFTYLLAQFPSCLPTSYREWTSTRFLPSRVVNYLLSFISVPTPSRKTTSFIYIWFAAVVGSSTNRFGYDKA